MKGTKLLRFVTLALAVVFVFGMLFTGCGKQEEASKEQPKETEAKVEESKSSGETKKADDSKKEEEPKDEGRPKGKKVVIGVSNGYYGTDWRTQMMNSIEQVFEEAKGKGLIAEDSILKAQHAGADTNQQIQQFRNMVYQKLDVIMVNANSATALNGVIDEAKKAGIPVISFDQQVTNPYAFNVTVNHYDWGKRYAGWLAEALGGKGKIVMIDGLAGHPAAEARKKAAMDIFEQHPDIEILQDTYGGWDQAKAQAVMSDLIAAHPEIDGVFVEDSMAMGVLRAFLTADKKPPIMTGEATKGYLKMWKDLLDEGTEFKSFAQANPPGIGASALQVAMRVALGWELKPQENNVFYYPISKFVKEDNLEEVLNSMADKKETYFLDEWLTDEQADALFK